MITEFLKLSAAPFTLTVMLYLCGALTLAHAALCAVIWAFIPAGLLVLFGRWLADETKPKW